MKESGSRASIAFFAHERGDARVRKRIAAFQDQGREVVGFTFHRVRDKVDAPPAWENIHLGTTYNRRYFQRVLALAGSVGVIWRNREKLAACPILYAVNTDNALLAILGGWLSGRRIPLVLELADIQPVMLGRGLAGRVLRAVERAVLKRASLLVTTSPGFVREYFQPLQGYRGEVFLLENKVYPVHGLPPAREDHRERGRPWVVGCFGAFRCRGSLEMMRALAERLGDRVRFVLRGYPAGTIADDFASLSGGLPNMIFMGPYSYPEDLAEIYGGIDFNWCFDESDPNGNSAWLLPNRIYEGGLFGVPALAASSTETGRWVEERNAGWTFAEPPADGMAAFFESLDSEEWESVRSRCLAFRREDFAGEEDYRRLADVFDRLAEPE